MGGVTELSEEPEDLVGEVEGRELLKCADIMEACTGGVGLRTEITTLMTSASSPATVTTFKVCWF